MSHDPWPVDLIVAWAAPDSGGVTHLVPGSLREGEDSVGAEGGRLHFAHLLPGFQGPAEFNKMKGPGLCAG